jgi:hypothetical protein
MGLLGPNTAPTQKSRVPLSVELLSIPTLHGERHRRTPFVSAQYALDEERRRKRKKREIPTKLDANDRGNCLQKWELSQS